MLVAAATVGVAPVAANAAEPTRCADAAALPTGGTDSRVPATTGRVWALPFGEMPAGVGETLKVVWRVTGRGPLRVVFRDPSGDRHPLAFGPDRHSSSTFVHPGTEWGTGFAFDAPGCWTVRVARRGTVATVGIQVT